MIKDNLKIAILISSVFPEIYFSQVGINTTNPQATFDIQASTVDGSKPEGLIVPRLTGDQIKAADNQYGTAQKGTILYASSPVTIPSPKTAGITQEGFYFFDGINWNKSGAYGTTTVANTSSVNNMTTTVNGVTGTAVPIVNSVANTSTVNNLVTTVNGVAGTAVPMVNSISNTLTGNSLTTVVNGVAATTIALPNIYVTDGTLFGDRTVSQAGNNLNFTSTATTGTSHFTVDGNTFNIDAVNNRIGIGTSAPISGLDIMNENIANVRDDINIRTFGGATNTGGIFITKSAGTAASPQNLTNNSALGVFYFGGRWNGITNRASAGFTSSYVGNGSTNLSNLNFITSDLQRLTINENGNVGIGTDTPLERLDVSGNLRFSGAIMPNNFPGTTGQVLVSAGAGASPTWANPTALPTTVANTSTANTLTTTVNGVTGTAVNMVNSVANTLTGNSLTTTVNGVASTVATIPNIYTANGTLTANRTVALAGSNLNFTSTATTGTSHFTVDGTTFNVDAVNSRVGIGTASPTSTLQVTGSATNTTALNAGTGTTINFASSNLAYTSAAGSNITLNNLKDGGAYTLIFTSTTANATVTFTAAGFTFIQMGTIPRVTGKAHMYNFIVAGTNVYVSMSLKL